MRWLGSILLLLALGSCAAPTPEPSPAPAPAVTSPPTARNIPEPRTVNRYADYLLVDKSDRRLIVYSNGRAIRTYYGLQFGDARFGHKRFEGDERTPEGVYTIDTRNPQSSYHLSLRISYPNRDDRAFAAQFGRSPGGQIFIHGQPNGLTSGRMRGDWTDGCIALTNAEIAELWSIVPDGTPIEIRQ